MYFAKLTKKNIIAIVISVLFFSGHAQANSESNKPAEFIEHLYQSILKRPGDPGGIMHWQNVIREKSAAKVVLGLMNSQEFLNMELDDDMFIDTVYQSLFDREANKEEKNYWLIRLNNSFSREMMIYNLFNTQEFKSQASKYNIISILPEDQLGKGQLLANADFNPRLEPVTLPECDASDPEVQFIKSKSDWSTINNSNKRIFCVSPGDYTSLGVINLKASGTAGDKRYIILDNGNNLHPAKLPDNEVAQYELKVTGSYWVIDRPTMRNRASSSGQMIEFASGSSNCIVDRIHTYKTNMVIIIRSNTDHHTIQRAYFEDMRLSSRKRDVVAIHISDWGTHKTVATNHKFIDIDGKNQCDVFHVSRNNTYPREGVVKQDVNVEGLIIDGMNGWYTSDIYTDGAGHPDPNGEYMYAEGAIDLKGGSDNPDNPVLVTNSHFWGSRYADRTDSRLDAKAYISTHFGTKNIHIENNVLFDQSAYFYAGDNREAAYEFLNGSFSNNLLVGRGHVTPQYYMLDITETKGVMVQNNTFIDPNYANLTGSGEHWARFALNVDTTFTNNVIVNKLKPLETRSQSGNNDFTTGNIYYPDRETAGLVYDYSFQYERYTNNPKTKVLKDVLSSPQN